MRWVAIAAQLAILMLARLAWDLPLPWLPMLAGIAVLVLVNLVTAWQLRRMRTVHDRTLFFQLCLDAVLLAWLLYFAGGAANPFIALLLLPLTLVTVALPARYGWTMAALTLALYTFLVFFNQPLPPAEGRLKTLDQLLGETCGIGGHTAGQVEGFALHVVGMWINFILSAVIVVVFLHRQAAALRAREHELQAFREQAMRHEKVLALALQAAGAAHKLGTPLATMAVLLGEMRSAPETRGDAEIALLGQQIERCKAILAEMVEGADGPRPQAQPADVWLHGLIDAWRLLRPSARLVEHRAGPPGAAPEIRPERSLDQALQSLFDNAANAGAVDVTLSWDEKNLQIDIRDAGSGIDSQLAGLLGRDFIRGERSAGLGIGFFLTNATLEYYQGEVEILPQPRGSLIRVRLPLASL